MGLLGLGLSGGRWGGGLLWLRWRKVDWDTSAGADATEDLDGLLLIVGGWASLLDTWLEDGSKLVGLAARALEVGESASGLGELGGEAAQGARGKVGDSLGSGEGHEGGESEDVLHLRVSFVFGMSVVVCKEWK